ncbi:hypothetical protein [Nocardiopsis sp. CNT312]|uniref:hypothetical protein n=1 Tax=Nocardiopsis sp. CNT312 TaxID=1137268 RepID=UPI001E4031C2|nr:hypothetical protein [Nocardiopsis sp. CNT312]
MGEVVPDDGAWRISSRKGTELAGRWWRWVWSAPKGSDPVQDTTGRHASHNQPDDLWFLAGTYGGTVVRRCEVPAGRPLFFPVLNCVVKAKHTKEPVRMPVIHAEAYLNGVPCPWRSSTARSAARCGLAGTPGARGARSPR